MTLTLNQTLVDALYALSESQDSPELAIAAELANLAWHRAQAAQDLRHRWNALTFHQQEIALLIYTGRSYPQIAQALTLGLESIRTHARRIYAKMGVASKKELRAVMLSSEVLDEYLEKYKNPASPG